MIKEEASHSVKERPRQQEQAKLQMSSPHELQNSASHGSCLTTILFRRVHGRLDHLVSEVGGDSILLIRILHRTGFQNLVDPPTSL